MVIIIIYIQEVFIMSDNIEIQAAQLAQKDNPSMNVRKWLQECYYGTLGTISTSREVEGFPMNRMNCMVVRTHLGGCIILYL